MLGRGAQAVGHPLAVPDLLGQGELQREVRGTGCCRAKVQWGLCVCSGSLAGQVQGGQRGVVGVQVR